jgi:aminocarboxymuconate-semialdehyde decarboxylase
VRIDLHTHIVPERWDDWASRYGDSLNCGPANLRFLVEELGSDRVVLGSDYPFDMGDPDPVASVAAAKLDDRTRAAIEGENALRFLGLEPESLSSTPAR